MQFELNEEQQLLQNQVQQYLSREFTFEHRQQQLSDGTANAIQQWQQFAALGWFELVLGKQWHGLCASDLDIALLFKALGPGLITQPLLMNVIMAGKLFNALGADTAIAEVVEAWRTGAARVAVVADCGAFTIDDKGALNGVASNIWGADVADYFILVLDDSRLLLLPREHSALFLKTYIQVDGSGTADLEVQGLIMSACMELVADVSLKAVMQKATQCMQLALCAEAAGLMRFALDATVDYCRQREQFGRSLSDFQVLQHRMADMFIECELAWSLVLRAAMTGSGQDVTAFHAMKYRVSTAAKKVGQEALQLHGGMGLCDEVAVSHAFKRLTVIAQSFGNADQCLQRYVDGLA